MCECVCVYIWFIAVGDFQMKSDYRERQFVHAKRQKNVIEIEREYCVLHTLYENVMETKQSKEKRIDLFTVCWK